MKPTGKLNNRSENLKYYDRSAHWNIQRNLFIFSIDEIRTNQHLPWFEIVIQPSQPKQSLQTVWQETVTAYVEHHINIKDSNELQYQKKKKKKMNFDAEFKSFQQRED